MQGWAGASAATAAETEATAEAVRDFLDSRHGRHFADDVASEFTTRGPDHLEAAIAATVARWQAGGSAAAPFATRASLSGFPT
jgi:hypothetical protein